MVKITHQEQQERWDKEHRQPTVLLQMDAPEASSGVEKFIDWLAHQGLTPTELKGVEMCCGKGRNVIGLGLQGIEAIGIDFSPAAIKEAKKRAKSAGASKASFLVQDATLPYPIKPGSLDFAIDCFGSTDIESPAARKAAAKNLTDTLKPGGYLFAYLLSVDDQYHEEMNQKSPGPEAGSFLHPLNGKFEKAFTEDEVKQNYQGLDLVAWELVPKHPVFFGKKYDCNHIWAVFQKKG